MLRVERVIRSRGGFSRRRDLLAAGCSDGQVRAALAAKRIFRVRHGWYSVPDAPDDAVRAIRVGGRLTGVAALRSYGLRVPFRPTVDVVVPSHANRLRNPVDRGRRLCPDDPVRVHWTDAPRQSVDPGSWRVSLDDALVVVLATEGRDIAVACCSAVMHVERWSERRMDAVFARAPAQVQRWRQLVNRRDESHGETFVRLWTGDIGIFLESQPALPGGGRLDFRASQNCYIEIDGAQHDPKWTGEDSGGSSWQSDHARDTLVAISGGQVLRWTYLQLYTAWQHCVAALERAVADDLELIERRRRHPERPRSLLGSARRRRSFRGVEDSVPARR